MNKICIIGSDGIPGGVSNYIVNFINNLNQSLDFVILGKNKSFFKRNIKKKFKFIAFEIKYDFINLIFKIFCLKKLIFLNEIKIIHAHTQRAAFLVCFLKFFFRDLNIKIIYTPHGFRHTQVLFLKKLIHYYIEKFILKKIDYLILITKREASILNSLKVNIAQKSLIKTAIPKIKYKKNISIRKLLNLPKKAKVIIMCGSVQKIKQPELFIDIAQKVTKLNETIYFVWIGKVLEPIHFPKNKNIKFIGQINNKTTYYSLMKSADIFLMTSKIETYPITILEARKLGLKIICNNFDGANNILNFTKNEYCFEYNSPDKAISILKKILLEKKIRNKRKILSDSYSIHNLCKKHVYIYNLMNKKIITK